MALEERMYVETNFLERWDQSPHLHEIADFFTQVAEEKLGVPKRLPEANLQLLVPDPLTKRFAKQHQQRQGPFDRHYYASIPYRLEEDCRLGSALLRYADTQQFTACPLMIWALGAAEGTTFRTVSELANGQIKTLCTSPTKENQRSFHAHGTPSNSTFLLLPFHHFTKDLIRQRKDLGQFDIGFDIIVEDTCFQMYCRNRTQQIQHVSQHLKPGGLLIFVEKFRHMNAQAFALRERQKNFGYKAAFFDPSEINGKSQRILNIMHQNCVTLNAMVDAIARTFHYCILTWNSGNFCTLIAGNRFDNLAQFVSSMDPPAIPFEYVYEKTPTLLLGPRDGFIRFYQADKGI